jgi:hypothetical protein
LSRHDRTVAWKPGSLEQTDGNFGGSGLEPHDRWSAKCTPRARRGGMPRAATIDKSAALILPIS